MNLKVVPLENIKSLAGLVGEYIEELGLGKRTDVSYIMSSMSQGVAGGYATILADDLADPKMFVWCLSQQSAVVNERLLLVNVIFITKDQRGSRERVESILNALENAAQYTRCTRIYGTAWKLFDNDAAHKMWLRAGYTEQESFYSKKVT